MARYRTTLRPASFGGVPSGIGWRYVEAPADLLLPGAMPASMPRSRHRYGVIETDRELTPAELEHFDIVAA